MQIPSSASLMTENGQEYGVTNRAVVEILISYPSWSPHVCRHGIKALLLFFFFFADVSGHTVNAGDLPKNTWKVCGRINMWGTSLSSPLAQVHLYLDLLLTLDSESLTHHRFFYVLKLKPICHYFKLIPLFLQWVVFIQLIFVFGASVPFFTLELSFVSDFKPN